MLKMKEPVNTITHFVPFLAGFIGLGLLLYHSVDSLPKMLTMTIFGMSIILLYGASSLYHWLKTTPSRELILRKLDHMAIFLLIAGTYTPILYFCLDGAWKWSMLVAVWVLSIIGMVLKGFFMKRLPRWVSVAFYLGLGWMAIIPLSKIMEALPIGGIILLLGGGLAYTIGGIIYGTKKLNFIPNKFGFHEIFHIFIVVGTVMHYLTIFIYVVPIDK